MKKPFSYAKQIQVEKIWLLKAIFLDLENGNAILMNFDLKAMVFSDSSDDDILIRDTPDVIKQREQHVIF